MLLISENKPRHPEQEGLKEACLAASLGIALGDPRLWDRFLAFSSPIHFCMLTYASYLADSRSPEFVESVCCNNTEDVIAILRDRQGFAIAR